MSIWCSVCKFCIFVGGPGELLRTKYSLQSRLQSIIHYFMVPSGSFISTSISLQFATLFLAQIITTPILFSSRVTSNVSFASFALTCDSQPINQLLHHWRDRPQALALWTNAYWPFTSHPCWVTIIVMYFFSSPQEAFDNLSLSYVLIQMLIHVQDFSFTRHLS